MGLTETTDFDIRYTFVEDAPYLQNWLETEGMLHWFPPSSLEEVETFVRVWMGFCRYSAALTATFKKEVVGMGVLYLMPYRKVAHQCLIQFIVDPKYHRKGVGTALIKNLKHLAKNYFRLTLMSAEVLGENPCIPFLASLNFEKIVWQEKFVKEGELYYPRTLMECELK